MNFDFISVLNVLNLNAKNIRLYRLQINEDYLIRKLHVGYQ